MVRDDRGLVAPADLAKRGARAEAAGYRLYAGDGLLAFIGPEPAADETPQTATHHRVWLATREPDS